MTIDREANAVHGFEGVMAALNMEEDQKNALLSDLNEYVTNERDQNRDRAKWRTMADADLANLDGYIVEQIDHAAFILKHEGGGGEEFLVSMRQEEDEVIFDGLPESMRKHLDSFSHDEQVRYPATILSAILR